MLLGWGFQTQRSHTRKGSSRNGFSLLAFWPQKKRAPSVGWKSTLPKPLIALEPLIAFDEEGRRHRTDAPYLLPKDDKEIKRLDYQHYLFRHILQSNTFAPVAALLQKGGHVLDVGCGTGRWGHEIAAQYRSASVIGFDLENVPRTVSTPLNYQFYRGNVLNGLPFIAQQFAYVHQRVLVADIPFEKWPSVVGELRRVTVPGGWVECVEMGTTFHDAGPATTQFLHWFNAISATRGIDASKVAGIGALLQRSGFSAVQAKTEIIPVGSWGGRLGNLLAQDILAGWPSMRPPAHTLLHVPPEEFDAVLKQLEDEWNRLCTRYEVYFACGQI